jgi:high affinity sulfate transporter 1
VNLVPVAFRGYDRTWLAKDVIAGLTLSAVAIPEVLGYTSISQTPLVTGLYTIIFPTVVFALFCSSRLLVVGADSATAAVMAAGLGALSISGLTPESPEWVALASLTALVCGVLLFLARVLKLGFIGEFLSASVLIGFLTGVGVQVLSGQLPSMLGIHKGTGTWLEQQWDLLTSLDQIQWEAAGFAGATLVIILGLKKVAPKVPGALVAVVTLTALSAIVDASANGVAVVGSVPKGFPPIGLPQGISWSDVIDVIPIALACLILILAQSAATSRSFAMKMGDRVDVNRDIVGLAGANLAAGFSGTFVVNGSPTKTKILYDLKGRTQVANLTMAGVVLIFTVFATGLLATMPKAVLGAIVFLIGVGLVDLVGMKYLLRHGRTEFVVALITAITVCVIGVTQGIILAIVLSLLDLIRRQYRPADFVLTQDDGGNPVYGRATPGSQSLPGLIVFRYDAELFYANANRFVDDVEAVVDAAPDPVRWLAIDCASIPDADYSASLAIKGLLDFVHARGIEVHLVRPDTVLLDSLKTFGVFEEIAPQRIHATLGQAFDAFKASSPKTVAD